MAFCPGCGYEFREGLTRCPDCDMDLVADLAEVDAVRARRLRGGKTVGILTSTRASIEALAEMLDEEGIPYLVKAADSPAAEQATAPDSPASVELHVLEQHVEEHRELLQELIAEVDKRDE
ncbi:MAG: DUF2007 domain-containing protein [Armatimonadota bacterium]|nr:MAG: DUF2007 domain-containing protein [Armatimonadota bacterium]